MKLASWNWRSPSRFLGLAYLLHLAIVALYVFDVIPQHYHRGFGRFWFHNGGDEVGYFEIARALVSGHVVPQPFTLGFPILLAPFFVLRPASFDSLVAPVAAWWTLMMFPLAQFLLARFTVRVSGRHIAAGLAVFLWTSLPLVVFAALRSVGNAVMAEVFSVHLTWAQMLSDGPATLLTLLTLYLFVRARRTAPVAGSYVLLGAVAGFSSMVRLTNSFAGVAIVAGLLVARNVRAAIVVTLSATVMFLPQLLYNKFAFGGFSRFGYLCGGGPTDGPCIAVDTLAVGDQFGVSNVMLGVSHAWHRFGLPGFLVVAVGAALLLLGVRVIWQRDRIVALVLTCWLAMQAVFHATYYYTWTGNVVRYAMPVLPISIALLAIGTTELLSRWRPQIGSETAP
jgi:hypothetical protein